jgi:hypothetical protein
MTGFRKEPYQRLELYDGKLSRTVLRGQRDGNIPALPDYRLIAQANPSQQKFINGWLSRAYS